jgi:hypothetical protein
VDLDNVDLTRSRVTIALKTEISGERVSPELVADAARRLADRMGTELRKAADTAPGGLGDRRLYLVRCLLLAATDNPIGDEGSVPSVGAEALIARAITFAGRTTPTVTHAELLGLLAAIFHSNPGSGGAEAAPNGPGDSTAAGSTGSGWTAPQAAPGGQPGGTR